MSEDYHESQFEVAVVIPWGGADVTLLKDQLGAVEVAAQNAEACGIRTQVLLACNRSESLNVAVEAVTSVGFSCSAQVVDAGEVKGPAHARNVGVKSTAAPYILFCDADDEVAPNWIEHMFDSFQHFDLIRGGLSTARNVDELDAVTEAPIAAMPKPIYAHLGYGPMSNLGVTRVAFERASGIDESLRIGEDVDFCWRAQYSGASFGYAPAAVVHVRWRPAKRDHFKQSYAWGLGDVQLLDRHRSHGARPTPVRQLLNEVGVLVVRGALGVVSERRRWAAAHQAGKLTGRIVGSARARRWSL